MENFNSGKEKIDTALVQTLPEKQAIKTVPLTESKGAAQARWMTPPRSNGALSVLNHPIAKADTAQREPPSMPTIADHSPALQRNTPRFLPRWPNLVCSSRSQCETWTLSAHSAATQQSIICLIRCAKPLFACIQLAAKTISLFLHTRKPSADSDFRTDMAKRHLNRGTDFKGNQTFSSIPQYTNMSEDMIPSNVVALANEIAHLYGDRN